MRKESKMSKILKHPKTIFAGTLAVAVLANAAGFCEDPISTGIDAPMDGVSNKVQDFLFGSTVRKIALTLGVGAGLFQAFMSGSVRPLLIYGGLGVSICYLKPLVNWLSNL